MVQDKAVHWIEEEQRQQKANAYKLQQQVEQQQNALWTLGNRLTALETALTTMMSHGTRVSTVEEGLRHTQEMLERLHADRENQRQQDEAVPRERQNIFERDRQGYIELLQKQETWEREKTAILDRIQAIEESARRRQEEQFQITQSLNALENKDDDLSGQLSAQQSQARHLAESFAEMAKDVQTMQAQDEVTQGRMQHVLELVRRLEGEDSLHEVENKLTTAIAEQSELQRMERQRLDRLLSESQLASEQYKSTVEDLRQLVIQMQGKSQSLNDHLDHVRDQMWQLKTELTEQFASIRGNEEKHRRRMIGELEQQIKEQGVWAPKTPGS